MHNGPSGSLSVTIPIPPPPEPVALPPGFQMTSPWNMLANAAFGFVRSFLPKAPLGPMIAPPGVGSQANVALPCVQPAIPASTDPYDVWFFPTTPEELQYRQYNDGPRMESEDMNRRIKKVKEFTLLFESDVPAAPALWEKCVSPEGKIYFRHCHAPHPEEASCPLSETCSARKLTIVTNNDIRNPVQLTSIKQAITELLEVRLSAKTEKIPQHSELVLDLKRLPDGRSTCGYYFAHTFEKERPRRIVFWGEEIEVHRVGISFNYEVLSLEHLGIAIEMQYWLHVQMFPCHHKVSSQLKDELRSHLTYAYTDTLTSELTTSYFNKGQIAAFLKIIDTAAEDDVGGESIWALARPMHYIKFKMFENFYGEHCARLSVDQSIYPPRTNRDVSWLLRICSCFLFWIPEQCMNKLEKMWVDDVLCKSRWIEFLSDKRQEWAKTITPATVLLSANVGLLAISSVDSQHGSNSRNLAQVASYASVLMSLGSYITGHILSLQHTRESRDGDPTDIDYLMRTNHYNTDRLAIIYSLPSALFMWSMVSFLIAMCWVFFISSDTMTRTFLAILTGILFVVIVIVMVMEGAANAPEGTPRQKICFTAAQILQITKKQSSSSSQ